MEKVHTASPSRRRYLRSFAGLLQNHRSRRVLVIALLLTAALFALLSIPISLPNVGKLPTHNTIFSDRLHHTAPHTFEAFSASLHILISAPTPSTGLCRTVLSAAVLSYPPPILLNFKPKTAPFTSRATTSKSPISIDSEDLTSVIAHIDRLHPEDQHGLVLVIDPSSSDTYLQLRPDVLTSRYRSTNEELYTRTLAQLGDAVVRNDKITQNIVFAAQNDCHPAAAIGCFAAPDSPLPKTAIQPNAHAKRIVSDLVDDADFVFEDAFNTVKPASEPDTSDPRPRHFSTSLAIGPAVDVRAFYARAAEKFKASYTARRAGAQALLAETWGEQEYYREAKRELGRSWMSRTSDAILGFLGLRRPSPLETQSHANRDLPVPVEGKPLDFGVGVDYWGGLVGSEGSWHRGMKIAKEMGESQAPYAGLDDDAKTWADVPLFVNVVAGTVPVVLQPRGDDKQRAAAWRQMWYYRDTRSMTVFADMHRVAKTDKGKWLGWEELCGEFEGEVFAD